MRTVLSFLIVCMLPYISVGQDAAWQLLKGDTVALPSPLVRQAGQFQFTENGNAAIQYLGEQQKLSISNVLSMHEDVHGRMWLGGTNGNLVSYDGVEFQEFNNIDALRGKGIYDILSDSLGRLWIASFGGGLHCIDGKNIITYNDETGLPGERLKLLDLELDAEGNLWVATVKYGVFCLRDGKFKHFTLENGLPDETINALGSDHEGRIWAGGYNGKIAYFNEGNWNLVDESSFGQHGVIFDFEVQNERLYVGCSKGLVAVEKFREIGFWNRENGLPHDFIRDLHSSSTGLWLATYGGGLINWNETSYTQYTRDNGMNADQLISLTSDSEGTLWMGSYGAGLMRYLGQTFESIQVSKKHPWSIIEKNGHKLIGTDGEGLWIELEEGQFIPSNYKEIRERRVYDIFSKNNELWFGTDQGVFVYVDEILDRVYNKDNSLPSDDIRCISQGAGTDILVGTSKGLVIFRNDEHILIDKPEGLSSHDIYEVDYRYNKYWICTNDGLGIWDLNNEGKVHLINRSTGLASSSVYDIEFDDKGIIWIGQYGGGIAYTTISSIEQQLDSKKDIEFNFIDETDGLNSNNIEALIYEPGGTLWVGSEFGLNQIQYQVLKNEVSSFKLIGYAQKQGIRDNHICSNNTFTNQNGSILWCTTTKLLNYNAEEDYFDQSPPKIHLQGIDLFYESVDWTNETDERLSKNFNYWQTILGGTVFCPETQEWSKVPLNPIFSFDQNHLTFRYAAINWNRTDQIKYRYRLNNTEQYWQPLTPDRKCTYQNIEPGEYTLEVQAMNAEGVWSKSLKYSFEVMAPMWKTTWFRIFIVLFALAVIYLIFKWRIKQLKKENLILDEKVKERTQELASEKEKSEELLLNILPKQTADELKEKGKAVTRNYDKASVLFSDFKGFTKLTETIDAEALVVQLDSFFRSFDTASDQYRIEKIKTIGDSYMCACGIPRETNFHAHKLVAFGLEMLAITQQLNQNSENSESWPIRIGIHSGPLIAGVVGMKKFAYDIWGDTVNLASRMESSGEPGMLNVSQTTAQLVQDYFEIEDRGQIDAKNKGRLNMFFVLGFKKEFASKDSNLLPNHKFIQLMRQEGVKEL